MWDLKCELKFYSENSWFFVIYYVFLPLSATVFKQKLFKFREIREAKKLRVEIEQK